MGLLKIAIESQVFIDTLVEFYRKIWFNQTVPEYLGESMILALWKHKGSRTDPKNWRGIMLSSILTKILSCIFVTRSRKVQRELFVGMVDLSAAFDWISRNFTWEAVRHVIGDSILITIMEYTKTTAFLKDEPDSKFDTTCGVRQGGTESPYAYNCLMQRCLDTFEAKCELAKMELFKIPFKIPKAASKSGEIEP